jgi:hypothetical protein
MVVLVVDGGLVETTIKIKPRGCPDFDLYCERRLVGLVGCCYLYICDSKTNRIVLSRGWVGCIYSVE